MKNLTDYFEPKKNIPYERPVFRSTAQNLGEKIDKYLTRLKMLASSCDFADVEVEIRDQVIEKCNSGVLRTRFLREPDIKLADILAIGRAFEASEQQAPKIEEPINSEVNKLRGRYARKSMNYDKKDKKYDHGKNFPKSNSSSAIFCTRCGQSNHLANNCMITKAKTCNSCHKPGHFSKMCRSKNKRPAVQSLRVRSVEVDNVNENLQTEQPAISYVKLSEITDFDSDSVESFSLNTSDSSKWVLQINGFDVKVLIDSGSGVNLSSMSVFDEIKRSNDVIFPTKIKIYAYNSKEPLKVIGETSLEVDSNNMRKSV